MDKSKDKARILLVGCGGIGCMAALNLEFGGQAQVTAVLRSSYQIVKEQGFTINSVDHGQVRGFRPTDSRLSYTITAINLTPCSPLLTVVHSPISCT
jgi:ketopantoate reductase